MKQNPFIVQRPIKYGEPFCNRAEELSYLTRAAERSEAVCILSIRRFGKTSLVNQLLGRLEEKKWLTLRLDLSRCISMDSLLQELERALFSLESMWQRVAEQIRSVSRIRPKLTLDPATSKPALGFDFSRPVNDVERIKHLLDRIVGLPERGGPGTPLCLVLDEFQNIRKIDPKGGLEWVFRSAFQERGHFFEPIFLGSERHLLKMMIQDEASAFFKGVTPMYLDVLPEGDVITFVKGHFKKGLGIPMPDQVIRGTYRIFGGHPYAINWFWSEVWSLSERSGKMEPLETLVDVAVNIILNQRDYYDALNSMLPIGAKKVLREVAKNEPVRKIFSKDFMVRACGMTQGSLQSAIKVLTEEDKIRKTPMGYILSDPLERLIITVNEMDEEEIVAFVKERIEQK